MIEEKKKFENIENYDYLNGLPEDFQDYILETKFLKESKKLEKLSLKSYDSEESKDSYGIKNSNLLIKGEENNNYNEKGSQIQNNEKFSKIILNNIKKLEKKKKLPRDVKNRELRLKNLINDLNDLEFEDQLYNISDGYLEEYENYDNKHVELNPKYEIADFYENCDYDNDNYTDNIDFDNENEEVQNSSNEINYKNFL